MTINNICLLCVEREGGINEQMKREKYYFLIWNSALSSDEKIWQLMTFLEKMTVKILLPVFRSIFTFLCSCVVCDGEHDTGRTYRDMVKIRKM